MENLGRALDLAADYVRSTWQQVVMGSTGCPPDAPVLKFDSIQQRQAYAESIACASELNFSGAESYGRMIVANDPAAEAAENGKDPWDMKPFLLNYKGNGTKARTGKNGHRFNIIPFQHGDSGGSVNSQFKAMPKDIHQMARALKSSVMSDSGMKWGGRLKGTEAKYPQQHKVIAISAGGMTRFVKYTHKAGIFEGMVKVSAPHAKATQSKYLTFRMVSDKSDPNSWWHPGRAGQPHVQWVANHCKPGVEKLLTEAARKDFVNIPTFNFTITAEG